MSLLGSAAKGMAGIGAKKKPLALKRKMEGTPEPVVQAANAAGIDTRSRTSTVQPDGSVPKPPFNKPKKDSSVVEKITAAAKPFGGVRRGPTTRDATIKGKSDSVVGTMVERFMGKKKPLVLQKKVAGTDMPIPRPDLSKLPSAAKTVAQRTDTKLKRMSQQITRGTRAANPSPFKKGK